MIAQLINKTLHITILSYETVIYNLFSSIAKKNPQKTNKQTNKKHYFISYSSDRLCLNMNFQTWNKLKISVFSAECYILRNFNFLSLPNIDPLWHSCLLFILAISQFVLVFLLLTLNIHFSWWECSVQESPPNF